MQETTRDRLSTSPHGHVTTVLPQSGLPVQIEAVRDFRDFLLRDALT
jgi:hypothetical protein